MITTLTCLQSQLFVYFIRGPIYILLPSFLPSHPLSSLATSMFFIFPKTDGRNSHQITQNIDKSVTNLKTGGNAIGKSIQDSNLTTLPLSRSSSELQQRDPCWRLSGAPTVRVAEGHSWSTKLQTARFATCGTEDDDFTISTRLILDHCLLSGRRKEPRPISWMSPICQRFRMWD